MDVRLTAGCRPEAPGGDRARAALGSVASMAWVDSWSRLFRGL
jgi:hypothetical protein